jgi:hypothetical protein
MYIVNSEATTEKPSSKANKRQKMELTTSFTKRNSIEKKEN